MFALVVNDFGIQYTGKEHADHLLETLLRDYEAVMVDWCGSLFVASPWIGIMRIGTLPYPCLGMCRQPWRSPSIPYRHQSNINCICMLLPSMEWRCSCWMVMATSNSNDSLAYSCIMPGQWTSPCWLRLAHWLCSKPKVQPELQLW
jgi:hypothetical protein